MRVKISYSVELEDVPQEAHRLIGECKSKTENSARSMEVALKELMTGQETSKIVSHIKDLRQELYKIDTVLSDTASMLLGYEGMLIEQQKEDLLPQEGVKDEESY